MKFLSGNWNSELSRSYGTDIALFRKKVNKNADIVCITLHFLYPYLPVVLLEKPTVCLKHQRLNLENLVRILNHTGINFWSVLVTTRILFRKPHSCLELHNVVLWKSLSTFVSVLKKKPITNFKVQTTLFASWSNKSLLIIQLFIRLSSQLLLDFNLKNYIYLYIV